MAASRQSGRGIPRKSRLSDVHCEGVLKAVFRVGFHGRFGFFVPDCGVNGREEGIGIGNGGADMRDVELVGRSNCALISFRATDDETFLGRRGIGGRNGGGS